MPVQLTLYKKENTLKGLKEYTFSQLNLKRRKAKIDLIKYNIQPNKHCKFKNFGEGFIFVKLGSFVKIKSSRNGKITVSVTDVVKSCFSCKFLTWQICLLHIIHENNILTKISKPTVYSSAHAFIFISLTVFVCVEALRPWSYHLSLMLMLGRFPVFLDNN